MHEMNRNSCKWNKILALIASFEGRSGMWLIIYESRSSITIIRTIISEIAQFWNKYNFVHTKMTVLLLQNNFIRLMCLSFVWDKLWMVNSPGTIVCWTDNFPFWAKILTDITPTYYRFWKLISYLKSRTSFLV